MHWKAKNGLKSLYCGGLKLNLQYLKRCTVLLRTTQRPTLPQLWAWACYHICHPMSLVSLQFFSLQVPSVIVQNQILIKIVMGLTIFVKFGISKG